MKIQIIDPDQKVEEYDISDDKEQITIGRSSKCDITIDNDNLSRSHLEINCIEGKVFIKDVSQNNWVSYNDKKLITSTK